MRDIKDNDLDCRIVDRKAEPDPIPMDILNWGTDSADFASDLGHRPAAALRYRSHFVPSSEVPDKIHQTTTVDTDYSSLKN